MNMTYTDAVDLAWLIAFGSVTVSAIACVAIAVHYDRKLRKIEQRDRVARTLRWRDAWREYYSAVYGWTWNERPDRR